MFRNYKKKTAGGGVEHLCPACHRQPERKEDEEVSGEGKRKRRTGDVAAHTNAPAAGRILLATKLD